MRLIQSKLLINGGECDGCTLVLTVELEAMEILKNKRPVVVVGAGDEAKNTAIAATTQSSQKLNNKNRIHVSNTKQTLYFNYNLAKVYYVFSTFFVNLDSTALSS